MGQNAYYKRGWADAVAKVVEDIESTVACLGPDDGALREALRRLRDAVEDLRPVETWGA